jgi:hypothetical protein
VQFLADHLVAADVSASNEDDVMTGQDSQGTSLLVMLGPPPDGHIGRVLSVSALDGCGTPTPAASLMLDDAANAPTVT